jgi:integration host factor subunit alpha
MALTKVQIADNIRSQTGFTRSKSVDIVETLLEIMKKALASGEDVLVSGFGKFCVNSKRERRGRNPATAGDMMIKARKVVTFKWSGKLRTR